MLNIKDLENQFDNILNSFTKEDLSEWITFAEQRETFERLRKGETVTLKLNIHQIANVKNLSIDSIDSQDANFYAIAA